MKTLGKVWRWIKRNIKLVLFVLSLIFFSIFAFWWGSKNLNIRRLKSKLAILKAQIGLERLQTKYSATIEELQKKKEEDKKLKAEIEVIDKDLSKKLKEDMTAAEIAAAFRKIGLL